MFVGISTMVAALIVYYRYPKPHGATCKIVLRPEAIDAIRKDSHPYAIAVGDFDSNGFLDLVVPNSGTDSIGIFLQNNNRTLNEQETHSTGLRSSPHSVVVQDFDSDGRLDIAVANYGVHSVGIFLGIGNGTFQTQRTFSTEASRPRWVTTGDFNNDQLIDLVIANDGTNDIGIFIGSGDGIFTNWTTFSTGFDSLPYSLAVGDLNHDDRLDVVVANSGTGNVGVFLGYGNGSLTAQTIVYLDYPSSPYWVSLADVNNDTHTDIVVACPNTNTIAVLRSLGDGLFTIASKYFTGSNSAPRSIVIGDFDNDTLVDILAATYNASSLVILTGRGDGSFTDAATFYTSKDSNPYAIVPGHFDNDTRLDLAVVNLEFNYVDIVLTQRNYSFMSPTDYRTTNANSMASFIITADLNNDTRLDLIVMNYGTNVLDIFLGNINGTFSPHVSYITATPTSSNSTLGSGSNSGNYGSEGGAAAATDLGPTSIAIGDIDNNSYADIVVANYASSNIAVFFGYGNGSFASPRPFSALINNGPCAVLIADLNGDKRQDFAAALYLGRQIMIFLANGRGGYPATLLKSPSTTFRPVWIGAADFNNDQSQDIAVIDNLSGDVAVYFGFGNGTFSYQVVFSVGTGAGPSHAVIGDFNNDGQMDLVVNVYFNRAFEVLVNGGNGTFDSKARPSVGSLSRPSWSTIGDWNNDQQLDIIVSSCNTSSVLVFLGNANGTFRRGQTYFTGNNTCPLSSAAGDFNRDGLMDLVVTNGRANQISVLQGYTFMNGLRQSTYSTGSAAHPRAVALAQVTDDRQLDVLMVNFGLGNVGLLKGYPNGTFPLQETFSTGVLSFPTSLAVNDLNDDHHADVVVANSLSGSVGILYGDNNGTFTGLRSYAASSSFSPQAVFCADFNHDSRIDIAVVSSTTNTISVMLKFDTVLFRQDREYPTDKNSYPHAVAIGDLNNDSCPDFVTVNRGNERISIFLGQVNGSFSGPISYVAGAGSPSYAVVLGQFTNDTYLDIVVSHYWLDKISLFHSTGNGTLRRVEQFGTTTSCQPIGLAVADFNNDHWQDVVAVCEKNGVLSVFLGKAEGGFSAVISSNAGFAGTFLYAAVGDFDNDSISDIAVTDTVSSGVVLFRGNGDGKFTSTGNYSTGMGSRPRPIAVADLNKDGRMDIVVGNSGTDEICVFLGYGNGSFPRGVTYPIESGSTSYGLVISDLNNDGQLDVAIAGYGNNKVAILLGLINGTFFNALTFSTGEYSQPSFLAVADFNNDTRKDIVVSESGIHRAGVFFGYADRDFLFAPAYPLQSVLQPTSIVAAHLNNDSHLDVIVADNATDSVIVLFGSGVGTFVKADFYSTGNASRPCSIAVADLNNDSRLDIVVANANADSVGVFLANENGTFHNQVSYFTGLRSMPNSVTVLDFNNDTRLDIAVANYDAGNVIIFSGLGNGTFSSGPIFWTGFGSNPFALTVGDVNNDQLADLVVTNNGYGNIGVLLQTC